MTDFFRVMAVFHHKSGDPQHRFVNSFVFRNDHSPGDWLSDMSGAVKAVLDAFYDGLNGGATKISQYLPVHLYESIEYRMYDLGEEPPRTPHVLEPTIAGGSATDPLPLECSAVVSLRTDLRHRAGRGRLFIGPMQQGTVAMEADGPVIANPVRTAIANAANGLMTTTHNLTWCVLSSASEKHAPQAREVVGGYVDAAWDTQRRRGWPSSSRTEFGSVL